MLDCLLALSAPVQIAVGVGGTVIAGHFIVGGFHRWGQNRLLPKNDLRKLGCCEAVLKGFCFDELKSLDYDAQASPGRIPAPLTGAIERLIFTVVVVFDPVTAAVGMAGWLGLKMAAKWNRDAPNGSGDEWGSGAFLAALTGLISMFIAGVGGYFIRWMMGLPVLPT